MRTPLEEKISTKNANKILQQQPHTQPTMRTALLRRCGTSLLVLPSLSLSIMLAHSLSVFTPSTALSTFKPMVLGDVIPGKEPSTNLASTRAGKNPASGGGLSSSLVSPGADQQTKLFEGESSLEASIDLEDLGDVVAGESSLQMGEAELGRVMGEMGVDPAAEGVPRQFWQGREPSRDPLEAPQFWQGRDPSSDAAGKIPWGESAEQSWFERGRKKRSAERFNMMISITAAWHAVPAGVRAMLYPETLLFTA